MAPSIYKWQYCECFCSCACGEERDLLESDKTSDIFELGGDYQYEFVVTVFDLDEVYDFLNALAKLPGVDVIDKSISLRISTTLFRRSYVSKYLVGPKHITYRRSRERVAADKTDHHILKILHQEPNSSFREVARLVDLPHTTVAKRIAALEEKGIIIGYVYGISSQRYGMEAYRLIVHTKGFQYASWEDLSNFSMKHPNVLGLFQCIGSWDYEFEIEVEDRTQVAGVVQEIREFLGTNALSVRSLPIFAFPKSTGYPYSKRGLKGSSGEYMQ